MQVPGCEDSMAAVVCGRVLLELGQHVLKMKPRVVHFHCFSDVNSNSTLARDL